MRRRVVITGLGAVTSLSCQVEDLWKRVLAGESGVRLVKLHDTSQFRVKIGGECTDFDTGDYLPPKEAKRIDRFSQFAMVAGIDAVRHSGIDFNQEDRFRAGVLLGTGIGGLMEIETQHTKLITKGPDRVSAFT